MKIESLKLTHLRNDIHFQFCSDFKNQVLRFNPMVLRIEQQFNTFRMYYEHESECLKLIIKSALTEEINNADHRRDVALRGLVDSVTFALNHFSPTIVVAGKRLRALLNAYESSARRSFDEETAAINNLIQNLRGKYAADMTVVGITPWVNELEEHNRTFSILMDARYLETVGTTALRMRNIREEVDKAYHAIAERVNALILVENNSYYEQFALELNSDIARYKKVLAQRQNRYKKGDAKTADPIRQAL